ncbi:MAG: hypothetical protein M3024_15970, partial [Candidatus Dormibacteraeota bacterium]|nr:hypothetical protein [Candidatus Dormibacteraeota bacterium]
MNMDVRELPNQVAGVATGAVIEIVDVASNPAATARKRIAGLEKKGATVNRKLGRRVEKATDNAVQTTTPWIEFVMPQSLAREGLKLVKARARRQDLVGLAAYRSLELANQGLKTAVKELSRLESAVQPPAKPARGARKAATARRSPATVAAPAKARATRTTRT